MKLIKHRVDRDMSRCTLCTAAPAVITECQLPYGPPGPKAKTAKTWPVKSQWWFLCPRCISIIEGLKKPYVTLDTRLEDELAL